MSEVGARVPRERERGGTAFVTAPSSPPPGPRGVSGLAELICSMPVAMTASGMPKHPDLISVGSMRDCYPATPSSTARLTFLWSLIQKMNALGIASTHVARSLVLSMTKRFMCAQSCMQNNNPSS